MSHNCNMKEIKELQKLKKNKQMVVRQLETNPKTQNIRFLFVSLFGILKLQ